MDCPPSSSGGVRKRELFAGYRRDDAPDDLDEPGTARVDDAGTRDVEQLLRSGQCCSAGEHDARLVHVQL